MACAVLRCQGVGERQRAGIGGGSQGVCRQLLRVSDEWCADNARYPTTQECGAVAGCVREAAVHCSRDGRAGEGTASLPLVLRPWQIVCVCDLLAQEPRATGWGQSARVTNNPVVDRRCAWNDAHAQAQADPQRSGMPQCDQWLLTAT